MSHLAFQRSRLYAIITRTVQVAEAAARTLNKMGESASSHLVQYLEHVDPDVRRVAITALRDLKAGLDPHKEAVVKCLKDQDAEIRMMAANAIGFLDPLPKNLASQVSPSLYDPDPKVRRAVKSALDSVLMARDGPDRRQGSYRSYQRIEPLKKQRSNALATIAERNLDDASRYHGHNAPSNEFQLALR
eukprot:TRINITY_DN19101_c0_g1_i2.p1 TRINITY_DN19101_c0_g1~~TRINITY_DN19101_c0_g1_i2.p1  ORF type:complete len:189 (-),score=22.11 TRINITY_DN19101_c0_g1_i2:152-718(-)